MIIDFHTHIFPPEVRENRDEYLRRDVTFAEMYSNPRTPVASAEDLLRSMDESGVDASVVLAFAWKDHDLCVRHNDYFLEWAARSRRIIPFCMLNPLNEDCEVEAGRCAAAGAPGLGELRPGNQGWELDEAAQERLAILARQYGFLLLFHVTEPVGHSYAGKAGFSAGAFYHFALRYPDLPIVGAHLAGGIPFYTHMPEVARAMVNVNVDTAAQPLLYDSAALEYVARSLGPERLLLGSDFPLIAQRRQIEEIRRAIGDPEAQRLVLGANAERLLGLQAE